MTQTSMDYVIEKSIIGTSASSAVSLNGFVPRKRVAFIIQGRDAKLSPSFDIMADCLVQRGYDEIVALRDASHIFCRVRQSLVRQNIEGMLGDLTRELSSDDVLFTAILGPSYTETGTVYLPFHDNTSISGIELRDLISRIPVHHAVHYVSPDVYAGDFAQLLGSAKHPDFANRHIAVAPTIPAFASSSHYHTVHVVGGHKSIDVVTPFHAAFFDMEDKPSLEARFCDAARYQRQYRPMVSAYMRHGLVHPQEIAFRSTH